MMADDDRGEKHGARGSDGAVLYSPQDTGIRQVKNTFFRLLLVYEFQIYKSLGEGMCSIHREKEEIQF